MFRLAKQMVGTVALLLLNVSHGQTPDAFQPLGCYNLPQNGIFDPRPADNYAISPSPPTASTPFLFGVRGRGDARYEKIVTGPTSSGVITIEFKQTLPVLDILPPAACISVEVGGLPAGSYSVRFIQSAQPGASVPFILMGDFDNFSSFTVVAGPQRVDLLSNVSYLALVSLMLLGGAICLRKRLNL
jgi:hypothetical protein